MPVPEKPSYSLLPDLASESLGSHIDFATDEWFAAAQCLIQPDEPVWKEGEFTEFGKWMDGWESRRRRTEGHDWCILTLGKPGKVRGVLLDTAFFTGNQVPHLSIMGTCLQHGDVMPAELHTAKRMGTCATVDQIKRAEDACGKHRWFTVLSEKPLKPGYEETRYHYFPVECGELVTHLRINYFPDGGVARLRVFGEISCPASLDRGDFAAMVNGGVALTWSNEHYGVPNNLLLPNKSPNMGNGWETARNPQRPKILKKGADGQIQFVGADWATMKLANRCVLEKALFDTAHFKGNYPESAMLEGCDRPDILKLDVLEQAKRIGEVVWKPLFPRTKMQADCEREFPLPANTGPVTHVRVTILPDGGLARLRLFGHAVAADSKL
eukprot:gnl/TRDRNA2_/TRDRNA2_39910_c0_seq1.p1 gnl/TRDRNA2_/TRDRNA2_39910_c0~~gnl/TRDRNA2_/TRDRNA2_39910_c0_seq1.p1  ORF type:complete len:402 (+),score=70.06 gnl/TRDRNA2_/TRDRNA2_39910_c0_seq1:58-1206(+)